MRRNGLGINPHAANNVVANFPSHLLAMLPRLQQTLSHLDPPGPGDKKLPSFDELPRFHEFTGCAWDVWGKGDQLGTVNLLTDAIVKRAAQEEIRYGSRTHMYLHNTHIMNPGRVRLSRSTGTLIGISS